MASIYNQVSVTDSATVIISANSSRKRLVLKNTGNNIVYIGGSSVVDTANNANGGYPLEVGAKYDFRDYTGVLYGICSSGKTSSVNILEEEL